MGAALQNHGLENSGRFDLGFGLLFNSLLQALGLWRKFIGLGLNQEGIKPATMFNRLQSIGADAEIIGIAQSFAHQVDLAEIGVEAGLGLVVGMADLMARKPTLTRQFTAARHLNLHTK